MVNFARSFLFFTALGLLATNATAAKDAPRVLMIGDSLTEGYGVAKEHSYPTLVEKKLRAGGFPQAQVVNAGTSGATSAFGARTMRFHFKRQKPDLVIYALGANDGLRGLDIKETRKNIEEAITLAKGAGVPLILAGMKAPPNYGAKFGKEFEAIFPELAAQHKVPLIPFLLEGVAGQPKLNLPDGIHPNEKGYEMVAELVFTYVKKSL